MKNKLFCGDNLEIMKTMPDCSIDLICTDPPYNSNRDFNDFDDRWDSDEQYLNFMILRMVEMYSLLKDTGSFYLHCDLTMSHYLKVELDKIFGKKNFRNEIIWHHPKISQAKKYFTSNTDTLLFYTKSDEYTFNPQKGNKPNELYTKFKSKLHNDRLYYKKAKNMTNSVALSKCRVVSKELGRPLKDDDIILDFTLEKNMKNIDNVWKISFLKGNSKEYLKYSTQKPIKLYQRIIKASSNPGDLVFDPFCGSGTTIDAAIELGRFYVGIDKNPEAIKLTKKRIEKNYSLF